MAIAPTKLGNLVRENWNRWDSFIQSLHLHGLIRPESSDEEIMSAVTQAIVEHEEIPENGRQFNTPSERVRVFLEPFLSAKGHEWAKPN